jgi:hypothetical protein
VTSPEFKPRLPKPKQDRTKLRPEILRGAQGTKMALKEKGEPFPVAKLIAKPWQ